MDKKKLKIYINGRFLTQPITGVQRYSLELLKAIDELIDKNFNLLKKYDFEIISPTQKHLHTLNLNNIKIRKVGFLSGHFWEQFELPLYTKNGILFCPGNTAPIFSLLSTQTTIVTIHDLSYKYFPSAYSFAFKLLYKILIPLIIKYADKIITVSKSEKRSIIKYYPKIKNKILAIQNGGLSEHYLKKIKSSDQKETIQEIPTILYVGSLNPRKNLEGLIKSLKFLNQTEKINAIIVGASNMSFSELKAELVRDASEFIKFKGQIDDTFELLKLYKQASCFVFPSFYEASPLPPLEAMACGCPVLASDIPSLQERCGEAAYYCDAENIEDIAEKIKLIIKNNKIQQNLIEKGLRRAQEFTWKKCAKNTLEVITSK
jgi:glycosyltransferase involved in cell wall biosynthesis